MYVSMVLNYLVKRLDYGIPIMLPNVPPNEGSYKLMTNFQYSMIFHMSRVWS